MARSFARLSFLALAVLASRAVVAAPKEAEVHPAHPAGDYFVQRFHELSGELKHDIASPRSVATLYRLSALAGDLPSLDPLVDIYKKTITNKRATPEARSLARLLLSSVEVSRGHLDKAQAQLDALTLARHGWLVGGFDNEGGAGNDTVYGPEKGAIDLKATYPGKERTIGWHLVPVLGPEAPVPVGDLVRPTEHSTFYFLTTLKAAKAGRAWFHLGTSGATKLWVNGQLVESDSDDHPARFDQHTVESPIHAGANTVLVKVSTLDESPGLFLRASKVGDGPLSGVEFVAPEPGDALVACDGTSSPPDSAQARDATAALQKLIEAKPKDGQILSDYATLLAARHPFDTKQQTLRQTMEKVVELLPKDARAEVLLAESIDDDQNKRREALEKSLAIDPHFGPARTMLAAYYAEHGLARRAYDEAAQAFSDEPDYAAAQLTAAEALGSLGLDARGERLTLELAGQFPRTPSVQIAAARTEHSLGRLQDAVARYRRILELRYDDRDARTELENALVAMGDVNGALDLLHRAVTLAPTSIGSSLRLANFLSFNGHPDEALALYDRLARDTPDDDGVFEARGQHLLRQGKTSAALKDFQKALALKPQNPALRDLVQSVAPQEEYAEPYLRDAVALTKAAPRQGPNGDDDALVLADLNVVRVYPNGLSSRVHQEIIKVFNERGVDAARQQGVRYAPDEQQIRVEQARIIRPDGSVLEAKSEGDQSISESQGMWFDLRVRTVTFSNLEPGDVLEFTYRADDISQENMFADYFGDLVPVQGSDPMKDVDYVLLAPAGRTFYANNPPLEHVTHTESKTSDGLQLQRWRIADVPRIEAEPRMPGFTSVYAYLHVSTFKDWDSVGHFWWGLIHDQLHVTPEVAAAADEAVKGIPESDVPARVKAVYDYVVSKTRYVGIEFGIQGFKPHTVDSILRDKLGDCKDKASLMYAMLSHLGIQSNLVLLRMRFLGAVNTQPASLAVFNHCILYVPAIHAFLDGTAEFSGSGELPNPDQGAQVLVVNGDGSSKFFTTPVSHAGENVVDSSYTLALSADGSATVEGISHIRGDAAQGWRREYETESGRREKFEQHFASRYPGVKVVSFKVGDPHAIEQPVEDRFSLAVPTLAQKDGSALVFSPLGEPWQFLQSEAPQSKRTYAMDLGIPSVSHLHYDVRVPAGYTLAEPPASVEKKSAFGSYKYVLTPTPTGFTLDGILEFDAQSITPAQYGAYRSYLEEIDRTFSRRLRLVPTVEAAR